MPNATLPLGYVARSLLRWPSQLLLLPVYLSIVAPLYRLHSLLQVLLVIMPAAAKSVTKRPLQLSLLLLLPITPSVLLTTPVTKSSTATVSAVAAAAAATVAHHSCDEEQHWQPHNLQLVVTQVTACDAAGEYKQAASKRVGIIKTTCLY